MIKKFFLWLLVGLPYAYAAEEGKGFDEARRMGAIPVVPKESFEDLGRRVGGATFSSSLFRERSTGDHWIGKSPLVMGGEGPDKEATESAVCREMIASHVYGYFGIKVPETVMSKQLTTNTGLDDCDGHEVMHSMSRFMEGYHDYQDQEGFTTFKASLDPTEGPIILKDGNRYRVEGLGRIAAIATWVHDIDFMGGSARNTGYRLTRRGGETIAEAIMIDPGESFTDPRIAPYPTPRQIQLCTGGSDDNRLVAFEQLCPPDSGPHREFIETLHRILGTEERTIVQFFTRKNAEYFVSRDPRSAPGLTKQLMERKEELARHYAGELTTIPRPLHVPYYAIGFEADYAQFLGLNLIYKPNPESDEGKTETLLSSLANPLARVLPLPEGFDSYFILQTGYKTKKIPANAGKLEIWFTPRFMLDDTAPWRGIMGGSPYGIFWTWGDEDVQDNNFNYLGTITGSYSLWDRWNEAMDFEPSVRRRLRSSLPRIALFKLTQLYM